MTDRRRMTKTGTRNGQQVWVRHPSLPACRRHRKIATAPHSTTREQMPTGTSPRCCARGQPSLYCHTTASTTRSTRVGVRPSLLTRGGREEMPTHPSTQRLQDAGLRQALGASSSNAGIHTRARRQRHLQTSVPRSMRSAPPLSVAAATTIPAPTLSSERARTCLHSPSHTYLMI